MALWMEAGDCTPDARLESRAGPCTVTRNPEFLGNKLIRVLLGQASESAFRSANTGTVSMKRSLHQSSIKVCLTAPLHVANTIQCMCLKKLDLKQACAPHHAPFNNSDACSRSRQLLPLQACTCGGLRCTLPRRPREKTLSGCT